jgi:hypothetical protein
MDHREDVLSLPTGTSRNVANYYTGIGSSLQDEEI